jgi:Flp pilus assembly protein TadB
MAYNNDETKKIIEKYERRLGGQIRMDPGYGSGDNSGEISREYEQFKSEMIPQISRYERMCKTLGSIITVRVAEKDAQKLQRSIDIAHLEVTPSQAFGLAFMSALGAFLIGILAGALIYVLTGNVSLSFIVLSLLASMFLFYYSYSTPQRLANKWRLKASGQMVPCILYIVAYMKHTSNLERAIQFVSQNLPAPLSLDFKKVFYDVETGRFPSIKESLDHYLEGWRDYSIEFIESLHLIESSLYEPDDSERLRILERSLQVILDGVYEKMLKFSHEVRSPLTNLYMLGIVLPTLGLALLPLASALLGGLVKWYHIVVLFNVIIPLGVFYLSNQIMLKRPGGYGEVETLEKNPLYPQYKSTRPYWIALLAVIPLLLIGISPLILPSIIGDIQFSELGLNIFGPVKVFDYLQGPNGSVGPFGIGALILSLFIPLAIALFFSISYNMKTKELIKARNDSKALEEEFASSLFQLGNRIGDGTPAEIAFGRVAESSRGQITAEFFKIVNSNIQQAGMSLEDAIFSNSRGAIIYYPSNLIATSMRILVESVKKGLGVAARSLMSISEYIKNIHKINERLRDLLAEVVSDMKSNMTFLAPLLAGIVLGLASMITTILSRLESLFTASGDQAIEGFGNLSSILSIFDVKSMIPPYYLQISIGIYIIQVAFILTNTLVTVDSGEDELKKTNDLGKNLKRGMILYMVTALISVIALGILASVALKGMGT